ncbi:flavin-dependent reductase [Planobispora rosea]|uniref:Flavin-dependent reductase n=1 Tax=Planobispora rosea TaxID=35762 RepID=A0A8J3WDK1_PLARO|nr:flavin reductase family protein [Planobispora rosea]GGS71091.1 flavin-dependent reductase [Planobispora rosea]GIH85430.1 flavin-dependent reductase [Planobispora rosea]
MTETLPGTFPGTLPEAPPVRPVDRGTFRRALAVHAAGVVVITAQSQGVPVGLTATSFSSVSLDPPLVSFYVDQGSTTWPWLGQADHFAVNILASDQAELAARFASKGVDRFAAPTRWSPGPLGAPLLRDVSAHLVCLPYETVDVGDHVLVVGLVAEAVLHGSGRPLLYHQGRFGRFIAHP